MSSFGNQQNMYLGILFLVAKHLRLGDVILAVNGRSLQGASHSEAVSRLKQTGSTVLLRVKPNQLLRGEDGHLTSLGSPSLSLRLT